MSAYAPPREDGKKPWVRESYHFGQRTSSIVYADTSREAKYAFAILHLERVKVRRATIEDLVS